jgi:hypothetical protein
MKRLFTPIVLFFCCQLAFMSSAQAQALTGIKTVGGVSPDYANITLAVAALNTNGVGAGGVTFNIAAGYSDTVVNLVISKAGTAANQIIFKKNGTVGANPILYGIKGTGATDAIISLSGCRYVTFDGIDVMDSTTGGTAVTQMDIGYAVGNSSATFGSCKITIKNCNITLRRTNASSMGIYQKNATTATSLAGSNHNNRYENIHIQNCYNGILMTTAALYPDSNNVITSSGSDSTIIGGNTPNDIGNGTTAVTGIQCQNQKNVEISKCVIRNLTLTGIMTLAGIWINNPNLSPTYGDAKVFNNTLYNFTRTNSGATGSLSGIRIDVSSAATATVYNNIVYGMHQSGNPVVENATIVLRGIAHGQGNGTGYAEYYNNSVSIKDTALNTSSAAFWKLSTGTGAIVMRNNIFSNTTEDQTKGSVAKHYACYLNGGITTSSNNVFWAPNENGFMGYLLGDKPDLPLFAAAISGSVPADGNELGSANANPNFISLTNLRIGGPTPVALSGKTIVNPLITTDISGVVRNATNPSIGAFETSQPLIDHSAPVINNVVIGSKSIGGNSLPLIYADINDNNDTGATAGSVMLWYRLGTSGVFSQAAPDSVPVNHMNGTYKWDSVFNIIGPGTYQFYIAARDQVAVGSNISVNPIQDPLYGAFNSSDPANYLSNPLATVKTRTFEKLTYISGGTYSVGSSGNYTKLSKAAQALATSWVTGDIIIELRSDYDGTTGETFPITIPALLTIGGDWKVIIRPALGVTAIETSGVPPAGMPLIKLTAAKGVTLDGRPEGIGSTGEWTIRNKAMAGSIGPDILFVDGAQYDTVRYIKMEGGSSSGIIQFSTSATVGNKYNYISECNISNRLDIIGIPAVHGISSIGTAGNLNDSNTILNNNIFNFSSIGVNIPEVGNGSKWTIQGNHFYNGLSPYQYSLLPAQPTSQGGVIIAASTTSGHSVKNNFIGGSQRFCGGAVWEIPSTAGWKGIAMNVAAGTDSSYISNNTIQNVNGLSTSFALWCLDVSNGTVSVNNNMVGHPTDANSIQSGSIYLLAGMSIQTGIGKVAIYNNTFANITGTSTTGTVGVAGIQCTVGGNIVISDNDFYALSGMGVATSKTASAVRGIFCSGGASYVINGNNIYDLSCTGGPSNTTATGCQGIVISAGSGTLSNNKIYGLRNTTANIAGQINGIYNTGANWNIYNNAISLGYNADSSVIITGLLNSTTGISNVFYNTISINGTYAGTKTMQTSVALNRTTSATTNVRNNILSNTRTGYNSNYAIANTNATPETGWSANYNDLFSTNPLQIGLWNTTATNLATWKSTSIYDTSSVSVIPAFVNDSNLQLKSPSLGNFSFAGRPLAGYPTDIEGSTRHTVYPYKGAYENIANPLPVKLLNINAKPLNKDVYVLWSTASEINSKGFIVERSFDKKDFDYAGSVKASRNSNKKLSYNFNDIGILSTTTSNIIYYRLKMVDQNGSFEYSNIVVVTIDKPEINQVNVSPNPFSTDLNITVLATSNGTASVAVYDISGAKVIDFKADLHEGVNTINADNATSLKSGLYFMSVELNGNRTMSKLIKE